MVTDITGNGSRISSVASCSLNSVNKGTSSLLVVAVLMLGVELVMVLRVELVMVLGVELVMVLGVELVMVLGVELVMVLGPSKVYNLVAIVLIAFFYFS
jgi:hypothetical protein